MPRGLSDFIMALLSKDPDDRPKNARVVVAALGDLAQEEAEVVEELEPVEEEEAVEEVPDESRPPRRRPKRGKPARPPREIDEERLARRVIKFAIFAGICVFLLLAFLIVRNLYFKKPPSEGSIPRSSWLAFGTRHATGTHHRVAMTNPAKQT